VPKGVGVQVPSSPRYFAQGLPCDTIIRLGKELKIETEARDDHQVALTVILEPSQMESAKHRAARQISEKKSIPGFRPGKAPYEVVQRSVGESQIVETAVDLLLDEIYPKVVEQAKIEPGAPGSLEKIEDLEKSPKFIFIVPLAPQVELGDYTSIRIAYDWHQPDDRDVEKAVEEIRQMYAKTETVDRAIQSGDFVLVDVKSDLVDGEKPIFERKGYPVFIRADEKSDEWPFNGFSKELIGLNIDETKKLEHKYPKNHPTESVKGKKVTLEVIIKMVRGTILPELTDEFVKQVGPFDSVEAFRDSVKTNLISRSKADYDDEYYVKVTDAIKSEAKIKYAPQTLEHEISHVKEEIESRLAKQGMDLATYLKTRNMDEEKFLSEEVKPTAIKRLERSLLLDEISKVEKIEVSKEILDNTFQQTYYEMAGSPDFQKYMKGKSQPPKQMLNAIAMESANRAYLHLTLERLKEIATGLSKSKDVELSAITKQKEKIASNKSTISKQSPKQKKKTEPES
jgi:trigger factor